jgi:hypothetical protein
MVAVLVLQGCSSNPTGPDQNPSTTSTTAASSVETTPIPTNSSGSSSTSTATSSSTAPTTSSNPPTIPAEASALPLPADNSTVDALNQREIDDRAAIESAWRKVWDLYSRINAIPAADRASKVDALMLDPIRTQLLEGAAQDDAQGLTQYGSIALHPYWYRAVGGLPYAVIGDCRDTSQFGDAEVAGGNKRTVGVPASNTVGYFVQIPGGNWKLWNVTYVTNLPCSAG